MASRADPGFAGALDRSWLAAAAVNLLLINALAPMAFQDIAQRGLALSAANMGGISIVFVLAGYAIWSIAERGEASPLKRFDWLVAGLAIAAALVPLHLAAKAALLPVSAYFLLTAARDEPAYRIGFIGLALTGAFIWGAILLNAFAGPILRLDAGLVQLATGIRIEGNILHIDPRASGVGFDKIVIMGGCSSLRNVSQALILWATLVQLFAARVTPAIFAAGAAAVAAIIALNVARIALIVAYPQHLAFIHDGLGATMISLLAFVTAFAIIGMTIVAQQKRLDI